MKFYKDRTGQNSAVKTIISKLNGKKIVLAVMDFEFIGGSMGSVVGHKIGLAIDKANTKHEQINGNQLQIDDEYYAAARAKSKIISQYKHDTNQCPPQVSSYSTSY